MTKTAEELYREKLKRVNDAIQLKVPDRVPIIPVVQAFPMYYAGITIQEAMSDYNKAAMAYDKFYEDFDPDLAWDPRLIFPSSLLELVDLKWLEWPGRGVDPNRMYQFIEGEYMKADEYDELIFDPTSFMLTKWIPRSLGNLQGIQHLTGIRNSIWLGWFRLFHVFSLPEVKESLYTIIKAGEILSEWNNFLSNYAEKLKSKGFPIAYGAFSYAPFDLIGDSLRGTKGIMTDIIRQPKKLLKAIEKMTPIAIEMAVNGARVTKRQYIWFWLHKGVDQFMSDEQYRTFYWPSLRDVFLGLIDEGLTPMVYGEGSMDTRLEIMKNIPSGKVLYHFENVDMFKAKEILGDTACISGNVPNSLLNYGTPEDIKKYCKNLIDICGKDGGYMMDTGALIDEAKPENLRMLFDFTKEYGVY